MPGKAARDDEDGVNAKVVGRAHESRCEPFGGGRNAPQPVLVEREISGLSRCPRFHLNERDDPPAASDNIHFTARNACAFRENAPAMEAQPERRQALRPAAP
jgi:hypothetical protein